MSIFYDNIDEVKRDLTTKIENKFGLGPSKYFVILILNKILKF